MKYLFWQFSAYAAAALALGVAVGWLARRSALTRAEHAARRSEARALLLEGVGDQLAALREERDGLHARVEQMAADIRTLNEARMMLDADVHVSELARRRAEEARATVEAHHATAAQHAARLASVERELDHVRALNDERERALVEERRRSRHAIADAERRVNDQAVELATLRTAHRALVARSQTDLTRAIVRAEEAEAVTSRLRADEARAARAPITADQPTIVLDEGPDPAAADRREDRLSAADRSSEPGGDHVVTAVTIDLASARVARSARSAHPASRDLS